MKTKIIKNKYFYLITFFIITLIIHQFFNLMNDDLTFFSKILDKKSILAFTKERYLTWSSRVLIESILIIVSRNVIIWRITNSLVITLLIYSIEKIFFNTNNKNNIIFIIILFMLYPFYQMAEAGFAATTINYLWPLTFLIYSFIPLQNIYNNKTINKKKLPLYLLSYIFACNQEQAVCIGLAVAIISLIYCIKNNKDKKYPIALLIISILSLLFIALCPGNNIRKITEIKNCYPNYTKTTFIDKIFLGIVSTCSILISNFLVIFLFGFLLFIIIYKQQHKRYIKLIALIQFLIILIISIYRCYIFLKSNSVLEAYTYGIFYYNTSASHPFKFNIINIFIFSFCLTMVFTYCYLLAKIFKDKWLFPVLLLLIGCGTRLLMGFSPTIFDSGSRTTIFLYFSILFLIIMLLKNNKDIFQKKTAYCLYTTMIIFGIINYILTFLAIPLIINL